MTAEELLRAVGQVDDELIREAADFYPPARRGLPTWWRPLAGGAAACLLAAVLVHLPAGGGNSGGTGADQQASSDAAAGGSWSGESGAGAEPEAAGGSAQADLRTPDGAFRLTGETLSALPQDSRQLGVLFLEGESSREALYTARREYAGCMLWEGPDGTLYIQRPGGGYAAAAPV